jgi:hypothetical protein
MHESLSVEDALAVVTAEIDQAQAKIDETRSEFPNDPVVQKQLDESQFLLDAQRLRVKTMKHINDVISSI